MCITAASWVLGLLFILPACSILPRPTSPPIALHDFGSHGQAAPDFQARWSSVTVEAPEWLKDERIRYRFMYDDPTRVRFYGRDRWLASPSLLLAQRLSLVSGDGRGYRLKIALLEFEQVFTHPREARVSLAFRVTATLPEDGNVKAERLFKLDRATPNADASGALTAFSGLIDEALAAVNKWLAEVPEHSGSSGVETN